EGLLDNTVMMFLADHGDMLGDHGLWAKRLFYEGSACVPMILVGRAGDRRVGSGKIDNRLVGLQDVMPTLLDLAGLPIPVSVVGLSRVAASQRYWVYGYYG
ncbi:MAG: sulfatase-like hydrolase/transferase, partial [Pirellulaceae bacterium]|nr:sulfatase-like hydrolase/transferase [Pirellulaceae bacterium]